MERQVSTDARNINTQVSQSGTGSQNSDRSEPGSRSIIPKRRVRKPMSNDPVGFSSGPPVRPEPDIEQKHNLPLEISIHRSSEPNNRAPARDVAQEAQQFNRRIPSRTKSTPNLTNNKTEPFNFQGGLRRRRPHERRIKTQPPRNLNLEPRPPDQGSSIFSLLSRVTHLISSPTLEPLDEQVLNDFNMEVGTIASRVDMWRQKLEDERSTSNQSNSLPDDDSPSNSSSDNWAYSFISDEIQHLLQMMGNLTNSLFGGSSWGLFGIEERLVVLLQMGSKMVFPVIEVLVMNIWRMLRELLTLQGDDTEKVGGLCSVIDAINNAFHAIRSLIHLGNAYRNAQEPSDSEYTGDARSVLAHSLGSLNLQEEEQKFD